MNAHHALTALILGVHLLFVLWVIFGAFFTRGRLLLSFIHILSLVWGLLVEVFPWTCPLTFAENWLESRAGITAYRGGFLLHYLDSTVYPNVPPQLLTAIAVAVFLINITIYALRSLSRCRGDS